MTFSHGWHESFVFLGSGKMLFHQKDGLQSSFFLSLYPLQSSLSPLKQGILEQLFFCIRCISSMSSQKDRHLVLRKQKPHHVLHSNSRHKHTSHRYQRKPKKKDRTWVDGILSRDSSKLVKIFIIEHVDVFLFGAETTLAMSPKNELIIRSEVRVEF